MPSSTNFTLKLPPVIRIDIDKLVLTVSEPLRRDAAPTTARHHENLSSVSM